ncbi:MAG TPA: CapA family protein [Acidimicrobiales bacterium]|nr:CapA family protein [Acidimicrobiales bacterium]
MRFILRRLRLLVTAAALAAAVYAPSHPPLDRSPEQAAAPLAVSTTVAGPAVSVPRLGPEHTGVLLVTGDFLAQRPTVPPPTTTVPRFPPERTATLLFAGDFLPHTPVVAAARAPGGHDFTPMLDAVAPVVSAADVALCHLEVAVSGPGDPVSGYPLFSAPSEAPAALAGAGFDGCSTASNHSLDRGFDGLSATLEALDATGIAHSGTGRTEDEATAPAWYDAAGVRVAHLSYTYGTNGIPLPGHAPWSVRLLDAGTVAVDAARARAAGADLVVVSAHWGEEYRQEPTAAQRVVADEVTRSGHVDLVVGHHAHVPQTAERVNGRWVLFGLGNFLSNQSAACCHRAAQDGVVVSVEVGVGGRRWRDGARVERIVFTPVRVDRAGGYVVIPVGEALAGGPRGTMGDDELRTSWQRTVEVFARSGDPALVASAAP